MIRGNQRQVLSSNLLLCAKQNRHSRYNLFTTCDSVSVCAVKIFIGVSSLHNKNRLLLRKRGSERFLEISRVISYRHTAGVFTILFSVIIIQ